MEFLDFRGSKWVVKAKVDGSKTDDPSTLKENSRCDVEIKNNQNIYFILDKVIDAEFTEI